jgi:hypothetical protein
MFPSTFSKNKVFFQLTNMAHTLLWSDSRCWNLLVSYLMIRTVLPTKHECQSHTKFRSTPSVSKYKAYFLSFDQQFLY